MRLKRLVFAAAALGSMAASAHPVAFKGAFGVMAYHQPDMVDWQATYTPHPKFALGVDYYRDAMTPITKAYLIPRLNLLAHRWNGDDYQANIYLYGGYGVVEAQNVLRGAWFAGGEADYETREIYFSGKASTLLASGLSESTIYQARAGIAPYVAESGSLHTWLIVQGQYFPAASEDRLRVGPVLRFFYENVLWEVGATTQGMWNFNFMIHF